MASPVRYSRAGFAGFVLFAALLFVPQVTRGAANDGIRLVSATDSRVVFEIDLSGYTLTPSSRLEGTERLEIEGFGGFSDPGRPWVPGRSYLVGVPPSGEPTVSWSAVKTVAPVSPMSSRQSVTREEKVVTRPREKRKEISRQG